MTEKAIKERLKAGLRENNLKLTRQRQEIINVLATDRNHPSAITIFQKVKKKMPSVSLSTVYYTLDLFKKHNLIKELEFYQMENRYEGVTTDHLDLVCTCCGDIMNFDETIPIPSDRVRRKTGFMVDRMRYEYYGYCKKCQRKRR